MAIDYSHCKSRQNMPTQEYLHELFEYPPGAAHLIRRVTRGGNAKAGDVAGWVTKWGYQRVKIDDVSYPESWLIWCWMTGSYPPDQIDHINTVRDDNHWENLELSTNPKNNRNKTQPSNNTSGVTGVSWDEYQGKWRMDVKMNGKRFRKSFSDKSDAERAAQEFYRSNDFSPTHGMTKDQIRAYYADQENRPTDP